MIFKPPTRVASDILEILLSLKEEIEPEEATIDLGKGTLVDNQTVDDTRRTEIRWVRRERFGEVFEFAQSIAGATLPASSTTNGPFWPSSRSIVACRPAGGVAPAGSPVAVIHRAPTSIFSRGDTIVRNLYLGFITGQGSGRTARSRFRQSLECGYTGSDK